MSTAIHEPIRLLEELADLFSSSPSPESVLAFRPSAHALERARELLARQNDGAITFEENRELDQFQNAELLMRLVKARLRSQSAP